MGPVKNSTGIRTASGRHGTVVPSRPVVVLPLAAHGRIPQGMLKLPLVCLYHRATVQTRAHPDDRAGPAAGPGQD